MTLGVGLFAGLVVFFSADVPDGFLGDRFVPFAALLAALAATVGLLLSWGEQDLSVFGILALAGYIYVDVSEHNVLAAVLLSVLAGLAVGAGIGLVRWLTRAPSAVLSLAGGLMAATLYLQFSDSVDLVRQRLGTVEVEAPWAHLLAAFVFVTVAVALGALLGRSAQGTGTQALNGSVGVGPRVIVGFALSGAAAGAVGSVFAGSTIFGPTSGHWSFTMQSWLLPLFAAVALGGVLRGGWFIAPLGAALGAVPAVLVSDGMVLHSRDPINRELVLLGFILGALVVSYSLHRLLGGSRLTGETPAAPPPSQPVPF